MSEDGRDPGISSAVTGVRDGGPEPSAVAALALARRTLEYVGWLNGSYGPEELLDADAEMKNLALAVYVALGKEPPARVNRTKGKQP